MKKITQLPPKEFLARMYAVANGATAFVDKVGIAEVRKVIPEFSGSESAEERKKMIREQGKKNLMEIIRRASVEYPEETIAFLSELVTYDAEESKNLTGIKLMTDALDVVGDESVISFLSSALKAAFTVSRIG